MQSNKRLQRTGISVSLIDSLPQDAVVARPLKRSVGQQLLANFRFMKLTSYTLSVLFAFLILFLPSVEHRQQKYQNNRAENSPQPTSSPVHSVRG